MKRWAVGLLAAALGGAVPAAAEDLPRGSIIEKVVCASDAQQSYALYVPTSAAPKGGWPILYLFDPFARGSLAVEVFQKSADTYGFLLAASNNSRNGPWAASLAAAQAIWRDTHQRFAIDSRRVYTAGLSGGARVASLIGRLLAGSVAGVIGCGAGFPPGTSPGKDVQFAFFGVVGDGDFNYQELKSLDESLEKLKLPHRLEVFTGPHRWPPEPFASDAIEWMRLREMAGGIGKDEALVASLLDKRLAQARKAEAMNETLTAYREYASVVRDFTALQDVSAAAARAAQFEKDGGVRKLLAAEEKERAVEGAMQGRVDRVLESLQSATPLPPVGAALAELRVAELKKQSESSNTVESHAAQRVMASLLARSSYELSQDAIERKDFHRAVFYLSLAVEMRPENPFAYYNRACAWARAGNRKKALEDLDTAVARGFRDRKLLESDTDLEPLRAEKRFQQILGEIAATESRS